MNDRFDTLTTDELSQITGLKDRTIRKLAHLGKLPGFRMEKNWIFRRSEIEAWMEEQRQCVVVMSPQVAAQVNAADIPEGSRLYHPGEVINGTEVPVGVLVARRKDAEIFLLRYRGMIVASGISMFEAQKQ